MSNSVQPHRRQPTRLPRPWDSPGKNTGVGCHFLLHCVKVKSESEVTQLGPTGSNPMDCSPPGSSVHGIFQARVLEWVTISFFGDLPDPRIKPTTLVFPALAGGFLTTAPPGKPSGYTKTDKAEKPSFALPMSIVAKGSKKKKFFKCNCCWSRVTI